MTSADTLMAHLPPGGWGDTARKSDLATYHTLAKADLDGLRAETRADLAEVRTELKTDIGDLRTELKTDIGDLRTELYRVASAQTRTVVLAIVASNATLAAFAFGAARIA